MNKFFTTILRKPEGEGTGAEGTSPPSDLGFVMGFDPFTPPAEKGAGGAEGGEAVSPPPEPPEGDAASQPPPADSPPEAPAGPAKTEGEDPLAQLREQVQGFLAKAQAPQAVQTPAADPKPVQEATRQGQGGEAPPVYNFNVPDQIVDALEHEDRNVRRAALASVVNGLANKLHQEFSKALQVLVQDIQDRVPQEVLTKVDERTQFAEIKKDLYGAFPQLGQLARSMPAAEQGIWQQVHAVGKQMGIKEWTPEFRDGVGRMLHLNLGIPMAPQVSAVSPTQ